MLLAAAPPPADAEMTALARLLPGSGVTVGAEGLTVDLHLSQPVPWRVATLSDPPRIAIDFNDVAFGTLPPPAHGVTGWRSGRLSEGWSRLILDLDGPYRIVAAGLRTDPGPEATLGLTVVPDPVAGGQAVDDPDPAAQSDPGAERIVHVVLDPGHGGIDPGAEVDGLTESDLMLTFARELREALLRDGGFTVSMTRTEDVFVPLETRLTLARAAGADLFLSIHADTLPEDAGTAAGATVYTLDTAEQDDASRHLIERHERSDLLRGIDLSGQGDGIAMVLMQLARHDTAPRSEALADRIVQAIGTGAGPLNSRPRRAAGFSVLKAPDMPAVLLELGFLSSERDLARLTDPAWRARTAAAVTAGIRAWAQEDAFRATLLRR